MGEPQLATIASSHDTSSFSAALHALEEPPSKEARPIDAATRPVQNRPFRCLWPSGLYSALAIALCPGPYLPVSIALVAAALGAQTLRGCHPGVPITPTAARAQEAEIRGKAKKTPARVAKTSPGDASSSGGGGPKGVAHPAKLNKRQKRDEAATTIQRFARGRAARHPHRRFSLGGGWRPFERGSRLSTAEERQSPHRTTTRLPAATALPNSGRWTPSEAAPSDLAEDSVRQDLLADRRASVGLKEAPGRATCRRGSASGPTTVLEC